jgi:hypothetical protein
MVFGEVAEENACLVAVLGARVELEAFTLELPQPGSRELF